jgi:hypothetical protein
MAVMRGPSFLALAALAGCSDPPANGFYGSTTPRYERPLDSPSLLDNAVQAVRVGELGPSFPACNAQGHVREAAADGPVPVRAAPFDRAPQTGALPLEATFFICSRSLDQRWLGIVYASGGRADRACGVSAPSGERRDYAGPCESGWVASAQVRLISGVEPSTDQTSQNGAQAK